MDKSLGKAQRISRRKEISSLLQTGSKWRCKSYTITFRQNNFPFDRLGVLLSRRIGNAVERNRIKRKIKEIFRLNKSSNPPFFDILIRPQDKFIPGTGEELEQNYLSWKKKVKKY